MTRTDFLKAFCANCIVYILLVLLSLTAVASVPVEGIFQATDSCPAYSSKKHKTNPDNRYLIPEQRYSIIEVDNASTPDWYRIKLDQATRPFRWVSHQCGLVSELRDKSDNHCRLKPGAADSNVLALSWQPGFCETYGYERGKSECFHLTQQSYAANHFTLHGLWPNQRACGTGYGYCQGTKRAHHCDYSPIAVNELVANELGKVMPSFWEGSCLERHEWHRHGTCQLLSQDEYFDMAAQLTQRFDQTRVGQLIRQNNGGYVSLEALIDAFLSEFGRQAGDKLYFGCQQGMLVDIWISLPAHLSLGMPIEDMVAKAPKLGRDHRCPNRVYISDFFG